MEAFAASFVLFSFFLFIFVWIANVVVAVKMANLMNRSAGGWGTFAFFFGIFAHFWLACLSPLDEVVKEVHHYHNEALSS